MSVPESPAVRHARARVAGYSGHRRADDPDFVAAKADLTASLGADRIRRAVAAAPPLSDEQRAILRSLLADPGETP